MSPPPGGPPPATEEGEGQRGAGQPEGGIGRRWADYSSDEDGGSSSAAASGRGGGGGDGRCWRNLGVAAPRGQPGGESRRAGKFVDVCAAQHQVPSDSAGGPPALSAGGSVMAHQEIVDECAAMRQRPLSEKKGKDQRPQAAVKWKRSPNGFYEQAEQPGAAPAASDASTDIEECGADVAASAASSFSTDSEQDLAIPEPKGVGSQGGHSGAGRARPPSLGGQNPRQVLTDAISNEGGAGWQQQGRKKGGKEQGAQGSAFLRRVRGPGGRASAGKSKAAQEGGAGKQQQGGKKGGIEQDEQGSVFLSRAKGPGGQSSAGKSKAAQGAAPFRGVAAAKALFDDGGLEALSDEGFAAAAAAMSEEALTAYVKRLLARAR